MTNNTAIETLQRKIADLSEQVEKAKEELKIEGSLQRVQTAAMAMKEPSDMLEVCRIISHELESLNVKEIRNVQTAIFYDEKGSYTNYEYYTKHDKVFVTETEFRNHPVAEKFANQMMKGPNEFFTHGFAGKEVKDWLGYQKGTNVFIDIYLETADSLNYYWYSLGPVALGMSTYFPLSEEQINLFKRFRNVFELAYRRYLDIEKALAQAREAQIEAALEKVRSTSMAMHSSDELHKVIRVLTDQFTNLGFHFHSANFITNESMPDWEIWISSPGVQDTPPRIRVPYTDQILFNERNNAIASGKEFITASLNKEQKDLFFHYLFEKTMAKVTPPDRQQWVYQQKGMGLTTVLMKNISLSIINYDGTLYSPEENDVVKRFAKVFEQSYTRFLDLKKAEAQAREAQIEAGLERVRSKTMAMHKSEEVTGIAVSLNEELLKLGFAGGSTIIIIDKETGDTEQWTGFSEDRSLRSCLVPNFKHPYHDALFDAWKKGEKFLVYTVAGDEKAPLDEHYFSTGYKIFPENDKKWMRAMKSVTFSHAFIKYGAIHWGPGHLTEEQIQILQRFAKVFEQSYTRFLDLQKAEAQAKEAQIEAALEKVRSRSLAMHKSEEMRDMVKVVFERLKELNFAIDGGVFIGIPDTSTNSFNLWVGDDHAEYPACFNLPYSDAAPIADVWKASQDGSDFLSKIYSKEEKNKWFHFAFEHTDFKILPDELKDWILKQEFLTQTFALAKHSGIGIHFHHSRELTVSEIDILKRFTKVFEQGYIRFLDLQKAEAQAREAKIEAALEKVRSRSLAMHKSDELQEVVHTVIGRLTELNIEVFTTIIITFAEDSKDIVWWLENKMSDQFPHILLKYEDNPYLKDVFEARKNKKELFSRCYVGREKRELYQYLFNHTDLRHTPETQKEFLFGNEFAAISVAFAKNTAIHITSYSKRSFSEEETDILKRFAKVFDQAYTRFLDLQKAEAQAREAQIETSLERVRSRTMAMHQTSELQEVIHTVHKELLHLNLSINGGSFVVINDDVGSELRCWGSGGTANTSEEVPVPHFNMPFCMNLINGIKSGPGFFTEEFSQEEKKEYFTQLFEHKPWADLSSEQKNETLSSAGGYTRSVAVSKHTSIFIINHQGRKFTDAENDILNRFAKVFEQTYTRFLDLQKAEAQAREAKIEAALERVRSRSLAMHHSSELSAVVGTLLREFTNLEFTLTFCIINLINEEDRSNTVWAANPETGKEPESYYMKFEDYPFHHAMWDAWKGQKKNFIYTLEGNEKKIYDEYLYTKTEFRRFPKHVQEANKALVRYVAGFTFFKYSGLQTVSENHISEDDLVTLERFGRVFEQSYTRFLDLKKAEAQARESQIQLALERVRARTMAMHHSDEITEVVKLLYQEFDKLKINNESTDIEIGLIDEETGIASIWAHFYLSDGSISTFKFPIARFKEINNEFLQWKATPVGKRNELFFTTEFSHEQWERFMRIAEDLPELAEIFRPLFEAKIDKWVTHNAYFSHGMLTLQGTEAYSPETQEIQKRFAKVFEQTYTRFLDLQKAEAQARKAQIEVAVERVRAKALAMHRSEDIHAVVVTLKNELMGLQIPGVTAATIYLEQDNGSIRVLDLSTAREEEDDKLELTLDKVFRLEDTDPEIWIRRIWNGTENYFVVEADEADFVRVVKWLYTIDPVQAEMAEKIISEKSIKQAWLPTVKLEKGRLSIDLLEPPVPEVEPILLKMGAGFDLAYKRFLDLKKAEAQAKEAQIEAALEKVRARTMGMQSSKELPQAAYLLFQQIELLGIHVFSTGYNIWEEDHLSVTSWMSSQGIIQPPFTLRLTEEASLRENYEAAQRGDTFFVQELRGEKLRSHLDYMSRLPVIGDVMKEMAAQGIPLPAHMINHHAFFLHGYLLFISYEPVPGSHEIFKRFAKVFEQTYTRFLDLQKAEAQAREAQIETALERIRARAMAMHTSEELIEVANILREQMGLLGQQEMETSVVNLYDAESDIIYNWNAFRQPGSSGSIITSTSSFSGSSSELTREMISNYRSGEKEFTLRATGSKLMEFFEVLIKSDPLVANYAGRYVPEQVFYHFTSFTGGTLLTVSYQPPSDETKMLQRRASSVFDMAYRRYLDLKKAEAQAREAKIEAALEKVRSRSMGMQKSEELKEVIQVVYEQFVHLGIHTEHTGFVMDYKTTSDRNIWVASKHAVPSYITIPYFDSAYYNSFNEAKEKGVNFFATNLTFEEKNRFYQDLFKYIPGLPEEAKEFYFTCPALAVSTVLLDNVALYIENFEGIAYSDEENAILMRFGKVFQQTYTRFLDLQKAEAQAREALIEAALERVRARALAMQEPEELKDVAQVLRNEMGTLGIEELETCSIYIHEKDSETAECWYALKDPKETEKKMVADHFHLELNNTWVGSEMKKFYSSNEKQTSIVMQGANRIEWINYCYKHSPVFSGFYGETIPDRTYHLYKFSHGYIGAAAPGDISAESWRLLSRAASVFSLAYSRFKDLTQARNDLIKLKEEKSRAEDALTELQATQKQLIQSEKMASLGELTAGIAHEIQNPLNFVNNFSDVSNELIEELRIKNEKLKIEDQDIKDLLNDISQNLEKINHHGKRADAIVKGMLQHSRSSSGQKELTDINTLAEEYIRLAYHGLRAKDKFFNAKFETELDPSLNKINIVPQEIGRVILNLINNSFYAVSEKKRSTSNGYEPIVTISTKRIDDNVEISVKDNGNGIPQKVLDKIFQPFFTTKPTGQGTGLGLSLSYDIITKGHNGEIKVETKEGEGAKFIISLPVK